MQKSEVAALPSVGVGVKNAAEAVADNNQGAGGGGQSSSPSLDICSSIGYKAKAKPIGPRGSLASASLRWDEAPSAEKDGQCTQTGGN